MRYAVLDLEADDLLEKVSIMHCLSYQIFDNDTLIARGTLTNYKDIIAFLAVQKVIVGHNIIMYDVPVIRKLLGINPDCMLVDTLAISWYLYPFKKKHGLEEWGIELGVAKPHIEDWKNLTQQEYIHRCETDVEINVLLFKQQLKYLNLIYQEKGIEAIINYLGFKQDCMLEQWHNPLRVDKVKCQVTIDYLTPILEEKKAGLVAAMPSVTKYEVKTKPKKCYKQDGELSALGEKWFNLLFEHDVDPAVEEIKVIKCVELPKSSSTPQIKDWLFSLGWQPTIFKYTKNKKTQAIRAVPQLSNKDGELCPNIVELAETYPAVKHLQGIYMVKHRMDILKGFIEMSDENGYLRAETLGYTNTLRFKHTKPIVNLPTIDKPYGKEIRGCIIAPTEDSLFCGSDMSSLEDSTKQHYMYYYDPEYVTEMRVPGFSPHLDIGVQGEMITKDESNFYVWFEAVKDKNEEIAELYWPKVISKFREMTPEEQTKEFKRIASVRKDAKQVNFSAVYGVGAPKMSLGTGWALEKSQALLKIYWERNKAVKQIARDTTVRVVFKNGTTADYLGGQLIDMRREVVSNFIETVHQMWLLNPISGFYYSLRYPKDIFSTLNQGTGVYCFDMWVRNVRKRGVTISLQYHDEIAKGLLKLEKETIEYKLKEAIAETNDQLKLNVPLGISIDFGPNYADCH